MLAKVGKMKQHLISSCIKLIKVAEREAGLAGQKLNFSFSAATFFLDFSVKLMEIQDQGKLNCIFPCINFCCKDISFNGSSINVEESVIDWTTGAEVMKLVHKR